MTETSVESQIKETVINIDSENQYQETINALKAEQARLKLKNETIKAKLMKSNIMSATYAQELDKLKNQLEQLTTPPLFIATILEIKGNKILIRQHGNNQEIVTNYPTDFNEALEPGMRVCINGAFSIISTLGNPIDIRAQIMEVINAPNVDYGMIGGLSEVIEEIKESIELPLTSMDLFEKIGIEPPSGVLLHGKPGTGKTLIAKAVAAETNATFIRMSGSDLVQKFIGEGARLVKDVFQLARDRAPSILFIDEIDAVGGVRTHDGTTGSAEVNRTMIQILSEMDGFDSSETVKVIAATNRIDLLDSALLRPGRFDRIIEIPLPNEDARLEIFKIHTKKMNLAKDVDFSNLTKMTDGLSGADLNIISKEAGMFVLRRRGEEVTMKDFMNAYEKVTSELKVESVPHMFG